MKFKYILAVDALSTTPFDNIQKNLNILGLLRNDLTFNELLLIENSIHGFENYLKKISDKIDNR